MSFDRAVSNPCMFTKKANPLLRLSPGLEGRFDEGFGSFSSVAWTTVLSLRIVCWNRSSKPSRLKEGGNGRYERYRCYVLVWFFTNFKS